MAKIWRMIGGKCGKFRIKDAPILGSAYRILDYQPVFSHISIGYFVIDTADNVYACANQLLHIVEIIRQFGLTQTNTPDTYGFSNS